MTSDTLIKEARALELSEKHASQIEHKSAETNAMFNKKKKASNPYHRKRGKLLKVETVGWIFLIKTLNAQLKVKRLAHSFGQTDQLFCANEMYRILRFINSDRRHKRQMNLMTLSTPGFKTK